MESATIQIILNNLIAILIVVGALILIWKGIRIVPQSNAYVVERFGKYTRTLGAGLNFVIPFLDKIAHRISVLERRLPEQKISVITKDNVEVNLMTTVFFRIVDASRSVYRINDVDQAIITAATSIVRSAAGKLDLDGLQSSRESMNDEISINLQEAADVWGIEITRTEIVDVEVDTQTKDAQRQQLNAERARRASIAEAEGKKRSVELGADARFYEAQKEAEATKVLADAEAYATRAKAEADADQTRVIAQAIAENGQPAVNFEILKRQVEALGQVASSANSKTVIMPTEIASVIGSLQVLVENVGKDGSK